MTQGRKHNWFSVEGVIKTEVNMTPLELADILDELELDFLGNIKYLTFYDDEQTTKETRLNLFKVKGDIRIEQQMTTAEFVDSISKLGVNFLGNVNISIFSDEAYGSE